MSSRRYTNLQPTANGLMRFQTWCLFSGGGGGGGGVAGKKNKTSATVFIVMLPLVGQPTRSGPSAMLM